METLIAGLALFFAVHSISIVAAPWRDRVAARLGVVRWQAIYSLLSLAGLALIVWGYGAARHGSPLLYTPPSWGGDAALVLLLPVFPLLLATYLPGRIKDAVHHPMLLATLLWAAGHLLATGTLVDLLLFGSFLVWAVADLLSMARRVERPLRTAPPGRFNDLIAVVAGLAVYALFVAGLHLWLFGVSPFG